MLTRRHHQRLRQMYRSAGWPCQDVLEAELIAAGLLERVAAAAGGRHGETLRVTDLGLAEITAAAARNRQARSPHESLIGRVAESLQREGRIVWRGLTLRVPLPGLSAPSDAAPPAGDGSMPTPASLQGDAGAPWLAPAGEPAARTRWALACPDVFSVRASSVEAYLHPVVHEIKVSRADLLADLKRPDKRAAYLAMGGACWYVLGQDARGRAIGDAHDVPPECGALAEADGRLHVLRPAPHRAAARLPFATWMALARATPLAPPDEDAQTLLGDCD